MLLNLPQVFTFSNTRSSTTLRYSYLDRLPLNFNESCLLFLLLILPSPTAAGIEAWHVFLKWP